MKDTLRTVSAVEAFESAKKDLDEQAAPLRFKMLFKTVFCAVFGIVVVVAVLMILAGFFMKGSSNSKDAEAGKVIFLLGLGGTAFGAVFGYWEFRQRRSVYSKLHELEAQIELLDQRRRAVVLGEVAIINRDLNIVGQELSIERRTQSDAPLSATHTCPACKTPNPLEANFCRQCGHKIVLKCLPEEPSAAQPIAYA